MHPDILHLAARVGFTGSSRPLPQVQVRALRRTILELEPGWLHHGDCVNADALAFRFARDAGARTACHPPTNPRKRAFTVPNDVMFEPLPYLDRNKAMVRATLMLLAAPGTMEEEVRSGTWSTVRFARRLARPILLVLPDGTVDDSEFC